MEELIPVGATDFLKATADQTLPYVKYSLDRFMPETLLTVGFILAIILDLFLRKTSHKKLTGYFALLVLVIVCFFAWQQWVPHPVGMTPETAQQTWKDWKAGTVIFPYSQSFFAPGADGAGGFNAMYGMSVVDNFAVFFKLLIAI